jgi:hypothetical protein
MHFIKIGWKEGKNPSRRFNTNFYLGQNEDVAKKNLNPLTHFIHHGRHEGRYPNLYTCLLHYSDSSKNQSYKNASNPLSKVILKQFPKLQERKTLISSTQNDLGKFVLPDEHVIESYERELSNWRGAGVRLIKRNGKLWIIKGPMSGQNFMRELLVYSLAKDLVNAAEIRTLSIKNIKELKRLGLVDDRASPFNTFIERFAQDYKKDELPLKSYENALAGEFVFSLWVRRRDATNWNRAYTEDGIPVFFDYHASLNFESNLYDCDSFFQTIKPGHAGTWRVVENMAISRNILDYRDKRYSTSFTSDINNFNHAIDMMVSKISSQRFDIKKLILKAGYCGEEIRAIERQILKNKETLPMDVIKLREILFSEIPDF